MIILSRDFSANQDYADADWWLLMLCCWCRLRNIIDAFILRCRRYDADTYDGASITDVSYAWCVIFFDSHFWFWWFCAPITSFTFSIYRWKHCFCIDAPATEIFFDYRFARYAWLIASRREDWLISITAASMISPIFRAVSMPCIDYRFWLISFCFISMMDRPDRSTRSITPLILPRSISDVATSCLTFPPSPTSPIVFWFCRVRFLILPCFW